MSDTLRVILEIGKKRKVVAGAMDWPGLDRWGTSEDGALEKLAAYVPRYADVARRAGLAKEFAGTRRRGRRARARIELDRLLGHRPHPITDRTRGPVSRGPRASTQSAAGRVGVLQRDGGSRLRRAQAGCTRGGTRPRSTDATRVYLGCFPLAGDAIS